MRPPLPHALTGAGAPVLLLHGLGGDRHQALDLLADDVAATRIAPDLPGHGATDLRDDEPVTFAAFAALVADLLDALARPPGPVAVVGVSMGAGIAVTLAATRPDLVARLVLIRPSWLADPPPHLAPFPLIARLLRRLGPDAGAAAFRATPGYRALDAVAPAMAISLLGQFDRPHAVRRSRVLAEMPRDRPLYGRAAYRMLAVPTLVVAAPGDPVHPDDVARTLRSWIPGARLATVPRKMPDPTEHRLAVARVVGAELASAHPGAG